MVAWHSDVSRILVVECALQEVDYEEQFSSVCRLSDFMLKANTTFQVPDPAYGCA